MLTDRIGDRPEGYLLSGVSSGMGGDMAALAVVLYGVLVRHVGDPSDEFGMETGSWWWSQG